MGSRALKSSCCGRTLELGGSAGQRWPVQRRTPMHPFVKVSIAGAAAFAVAAWASLAQAQEIKRTEIKRSDLTGTNMEVIMTVLEAPPGAVLPKHFHHGEEAFYVLEGAMTEVPGQPAGPRIPAPAASMSARCPTPATKWSATSRSSCSPCMSSTRASRWPSTCRRGASGAQRVGALRTLKLRPRDAAWHLGLLRSESPGRTSRGARRASPRARADRCQ